jgi:hypothetical protein
VAASTERTIQQRRKRMNRQINERLRTLIAGLALGHRDNHDPAA